MRREFDALLELARAAQPTDDYLATIFLTQPLSSQPSTSDYCSILHAFKSLKRPAGPWLTTMFSSVQWETEAAAAQMNSEPTPACGYEQTRRIVPLLECSRNTSVISRDEGAASTTSSSSSDATTGYRRGSQGASNGLWMYQEQLINLFWVQDLPLREVQEIMKREYGLDVR